MIENNTTQRPSLPSKHDLGFCATVFLVALAIICFLGALLHHLQMIDAIELLKSREMIAIALGAAAIAVSISFFSRRVLMPQSKEKWIQYTFSPRSFPELPSFKLQKN